MFEHYRDYAWERSALNAALLRGKQWALGASLAANPSATGQWCVVFTNSEAACWCHWS